MLKWSWGWWQDALRFLSTHWDICLNQFMPSYCDLFLYCIYCSFKTGMTDMSQSSHNPVLANIMVESVFLLLPEMWHRKSGHRFCILACLKFVGTLLYAYLSYTQSGAEKVIWQSWQLAWHCYSWWSLSNILWATLTRLWLYSSSLYCVNCCGEYALHCQRSVFLWNITMHFTVWWSFPLSIRWRCGHVGSVHNRVLHSRVESSFSDANSIQFA